MVRLERDMADKAGRRRPGRLARGACPAAAASAVASAAALGDVPGLLRALRDGRRRVSEAAGKALLRGGFAVPREQLFELFVRDRRDHVRGQVVRLLARGSRVRSIVSLLWACTLVPAGRVHEAAVHGLRRWGPVWPDVPLPEVFELAAALCAAEGALPADLADALWAYVTFRTDLPRRRCLEVARADRTGDAARVWWPPVAPASTSVTLQTSWAARVVRRRFELAPRPFARLRALWPLRRPMPR